MTKRSFFLGSLLAIAAPAAVAQAPARMSTNAPNIPASTPSTRKGMYVSAALGYGSAGITCDGCSANRENGLSGYFRIGGTVNPHLRLGIESDGWAKSIQGVDEKIGPAVVIVVVEVDAHAAEGMAIVVIGDVGFEAHLGEAASPQVVE